MKKDIVTDVPGAFKAWSRGTVVRSWLLDLMVDALDENPTLDDVSDYTNDSGEGRWTVEEAIALGVPMPVISASLFARFASRQEVSPTMQAVSALRGQFGGHQVMTVDEGEALRRGTSAGARKGGRRPEHRRGALRDEARQPAVGGQGVCSPRHRCEEGGVHRQGPGHSTHRLGRHRSGQTGCRSAPQAAHQTTDQARDQARREEGVTPGTCTSDT